MTEADLWFGGIYAIICIVYLIVLHNTMKESRKNQKQ